MKDKVFYGEETSKAAANFGRGQLPSELVKAYASVKKAVLSAIQEAERRFPENVFECIMQAVDEIMKGGHQDQFIIPLMQGGAGTSINMNLNEVISSLTQDIYRDKYNAEIKCDPIEDINRYQSTNDTFPTAATIFIYDKLSALENSVISFQESLIDKETEYSSVLIEGRTEMQSALPVTLGQVFSSWAGMIERDRWRLNKLKERIRTIALGGTAIGTCFDAPQKVVFLSEKNLRQITGLPLCRSQNLTDEVANQDKFSELAGGLKICAENIFKITGDLLLYTSSFIGEIKHPELQKASTIMAAKINPVILEFARGLSINARHECMKISEYCMNGQLQLNPYLPFILNSFISAFDSVMKAISVLIEKFLNKMSVDEKKAERNLASSYALLNALLPVLGYRRIEKIYKLIDIEKPGNIARLKEIITETTGLDAETLDAYFDPSRLTSYRKDCK